MKKLMLLLFALLLATSALADNYLDPDIMGLYFDTVASEPCLNGVGAFTTLSLFLLISNPSFDVLYGWEAGYDFTGEGIILATNLLDISLPSDSSEVPGNHIVVFGIPQETTPVIMLASITLIYLDTAQESMEFFLHGSEPGSLEGDLPVALLENGALMNLGLSVNDGPVALINGVCGSLATDFLSFDGIKCLYR